MKKLNKIRKKLPIRKFKNMGIIIGLLYFCISCEFDTKTDESITYYKDYDLSFTKYFESNPERFSILYDILDTTGLVHLFRTYGNYTFLAPTDSAFATYFEEKGKSSYLDFQTDELTSLIKYHVFPNLFISGSFNSGIIESKTLSSDLMVSSPTPDGTDVLLNKNARIILKDEFLPNGVIHVVDKVIEKPEASIYDWLKENQADYSIFLEAIEKTGLDQLLSKSDADSNEFFTGFITPDSKYIESNINSFEDLAQRISPTYNNYSDTSNVLYSFMASHFTTEIVSMSDATEDQVFFGTVGKASAKFGLRPSTADVVINYYTSDFPRGLDVDELNSNNLVSNGIIHVMDTMYQIPESFLRTNLLFYICDVPGLPFDSVYNAALEIFLVEGRSGEPKYRFWPPDNGPRHLPFERTNGWLTLNAPYPGYIKFDAHKVKEWNSPRDYYYGDPEPILLGTETVAGGLLDLTRKLPYVIPGKYKLIFVSKTGPSRPSVKFYFDGKSVGAVINLEAGLGFIPIDLGIVEINEGETEHFLRIEHVTEGGAYHSAIRLEPVD